MIPVSGHVQLASPWTPIQKKPCKPLVLERLPKSPSVHLKSGNFGLLDHVTCEPVTQLSCLIVLKYTWTSKMPKNKYPNIPKQRV